MNIKKYVTDFALSFIITLVVSAVVSFLYSLIAHGKGVVDWESSFRLAIIFGILLSWLQQHDKKEK